MNPAALLLFIFGIILGCFSLVFLIIAIRNLRQLLYILDREEMRLGFTGTSSKVTSEQVSAFEAVCKLPGITEFHYGDCIEADEMAFNTIRRYSPDTKTVAHPGCDKYGQSPKRAYTEADEILSTRAYLARNHDIVNSVDYLIATPKEFEEQQRSGTWATVRYAEAREIPILIIYPDGSLEER